MAQNTGFTRRTLRDWNILADTWWYGLTNRLSEADFLALAALRASQGFSAVQIVVGVPPEVGPQHPSAASSVGPAWDLFGMINERYLAMARQRLEYLVSCGLTPVVYGAWGPQIEWIGLDGITQWWRAVIKAVDDLPVIYCLSGESDLSLETPAALLRWWRPAFRTAKRVLKRFVHDDRIMRSVRMWVTTGRRRRRRRLWTTVLRRLSSKTKRPIIIHPTYEESGCQAIEDPDLLWADTFQTGHDSTSRNRLSRLWVEAAADHRRNDWINLEPWYEGITGQFFRNDQIYSYWVCMLSGAVGYCYGAHGIWNVGDGVFLNHWGSQTFQEARQLETPWMLGASHALWRDEGAFGADPVIMRRGRRLVSIANVGPRGRVTFVPNAADANGITGRVWSPLTMRFVGQLPRAGPVLVLD
jgi:hypothetical protein